MGRNLAQGIVRISDEPEMSGADILANIKALRPALQARTNEIEQLRRLPEDVVEMLKKSGAFRMMMPRAWGGPEMNLMEISEALEELAVGNSAAAWVAMIQMDSGLYSGLLPADTAREVYSDLDSTTSNVLRQAGRAVSVDGGYIVNGRWPFASGCTHSDWFAGNCALDQAENPRSLGANAEGPFLMLFLAPREEWVIHDTWHTIGLRGTGSNDVEAVNLFVPAERAIVVPMHGYFKEIAPSHQGALYRWPAVLCAKMPAVALGIARAAIESTIALVKKRNGFSDELAFALADAQTAYSSSRAYLYRSLERLWDCLEGGGPLDESIRVDVMLARTNAFQSARSAIQKLFDAIGGGAYAQYSDLERHLRDVNTACQHVMAKRGCPLTAGKLMLGAPSDIAFL